MSAATITQPSCVPDAQAADIPPLENGDCLTRAKFYRRWEAMPDLKSAERIEGIVYMAAAVRRKRHGQPHGHVVGWLAHYYAATPGTDFGDSTTAQLDPDNDPQPDSYLLILPECGGQCRFTEDDYISGGPELIGEIAASSASRDLHQKFHVYRRNGVREYIVWKTMENKIVWFRLQDDAYVEVEPEGGIFKSTVFPGLWLDADAMIRGDLKSVLETLAQGIATGEHAAFVRELQSRQSGSGDRPTSSD